MAHFFLYLLIGAFYAEVSRRSFRASDHPRGVCEMCIAFLHMGLASMTIDLGITSIVPPII